MATSSATKPTVLFMSRTNDIQGLEKLKEKATVKYAQFNESGDAAEVIEKHSSARAIWIITPAIAQPRHHPAANFLSRKVVEYVRNGGTVVLDRIFNYITPSDFNDWMRDTWDLPWRFGCHATTVAIIERPATGRDASGKGWQQGLMPVYKSQFVCLKNVELKDAWYVVPRGATDASASQKPSGLPWDIGGQAPIAFTKIGAGYLGWIGDVDNSENAVSVVLAMMGLQGDK
ncbi:hypothetical protein M406DRAFT_328893 [Cryphonectria parasitica EP155]|uniref:Uncharacterized protein n=1 Tax=Cryphonectria parasitica (strain ATCC 38755 / EP155) TaxID=660469 RepID=A0A9P5CR35_CRYP1|nr:uncharacterized protein M406DRAFT_328893 [Cryphonectria parasitica EP155]KAF3767838.1 hypothetical protein M406DRAFT_328893 [Cryphonectria parasitica EP155]